MNELSNAISASSSGMKAQSMRLRLLSENIANADTPGYRRKTVSFNVDDTAKGTIKTGPVQLDKTELSDIYDPNHPMADTSGHYQGSNVNLLIEIADAREAQRGYEANLKMFDQAKQMSANLLDLLQH